jgi:hypothetical protein
MKKATLLLLGAICLLCASCEKEEDNFPYNNYNSSSNSDSNSSSTNQTGTIMCINNTDDPYKVVISGNTPKTFTLNGGYNITATVSYGYYSVKVTQLSGYVFYATEKEYSGYVNSSNPKWVISF